jgi:hypothetical protein
MTVEDALKIELIQTALKIEKVKQYQRKLEKEFPDWADVGEAKRFNALLDEIVEIYQYQK